MMDGFTFQVTPMALFGYHLMQEKISGFQLPTILSRRMDIQKYHSMIVYMGRIGPNVLKTLTTPIQVVHEFLITGDQLKIKEML